MAMVLLNILILLVGFVALVKGADWFVDGSAGLARYFHVPGLIIGLTIVAMGTSAPELAVSVTAAVQGANEIALSNVIGSNIFNLLVVLGLCAAIHPVPVDNDVIKRDFPLSLAATLFLLAAVALPALLSGELAGAAMADNVGIAGRIVGAALLLAFGAYLFFLIREARKHPDTAEDAPARSLGRCLALIPVGIALIVGGGEAVVHAARELALAAGMSETLVGLTIVAMGTSLPELVTSMVAAQKGETSLALGNAVGSNLFNIMLILGVSTVIHPVGVNLASVCDLVILLAISVVTYVFARTGSRIDRREGVVMLLLYLADLAFAIVR